MQTPNRPCTSPRRHQCRNGGKPKLPDPWNPNGPEGWFTMPMPEERAAQKKASREEDQRRLDVGEVTLEELKRKNSWLPLHRILPIDYCKVPRLK